MECLFILDIQYSLKWILSEIAPLEFQDEDKRQVLSGWVLFVCSLSFEQRGLDR